MGVRLAFCFEMDRSLSVDSQGWKIVEETCFQTGKKLVEDGNIGKNLMERIQNPGVSQE